LPPTILCAWFWNSNVSSSSVRQDFSPLTSALYIPARLVIRSSLAYGLLTMTNIRCRKKIYRSTKEKRLFERKYLAGIKSKWSPESLLRKLQGVTKKSDVQVNPSSIAVEMDFQGLLDFALVLALKKHCQSDANAQRDALTDR
jgi:hypothetical protein